MLVTYFTYLHLMLYIYAQNAAFYIKTHNIHNVRFLHGIKNKILKYYLLFNFVLQSINDK